MPSKGECGTGKGRQPGLTTSPTHHVAYIEYLYVSRELSPFHGFFSIFFTVALEIGIVVPLFYRRNRGGCFSVSVYMVDRM